MPINLADLQIFDHYATTYQPNKSSKYDTHDYHKLKKIYSDIQWKNRFAPALLNDPEAKDVSAAIALKEQACEFRHTLSSLQQNESGNMFVQQNPFSTNPELVSVTRKGKNDSDTTDSLTLQILAFASPQKNIGKYLQSEDEIAFPSGSYSFELYIKKKHYELQFGIPENATNLQIQEKIQKLINKSNLGIEASIIKDSDSPGFTALQLSSDATGIPYQGDLHFEIADNPAKPEKEIVKYLGLNEEILPPTNAECIIDGKNVSSYCNDLSINNYKITLHPENADQFDFTEPIQIGMSPNVESMKQNIDIFMQGFNRFVNDSTTTTSGTSDRFQHMLKKLTHIYQNELSKCGIAVSDEKLLDYAPDAPRIDDTLADLNTINGLQDFGNAVLKQMDDVTLDPMEYVNKSICFYRDPSTPFINPYTTSIYTGMLFQAYI